MISPLAFVDPTAKIGDNVTIYPFAYVDKDVEIGDGCIVMPNASIMQGARLGKNVKVYNKARRLKTSAGKAKRRTLSSATTP